MTTLEVCIDDVAGLDACNAGGADRIELCSALELGGLTPSLGLMQAAARQDLPCYAMIRPRAGSFIYNAAEIEVMRDDIAAVRATGLAGVVVGAATIDSMLDVRALEQFCDASNGLVRVLHRVIDVLSDPMIAIDQAIDLGFERILTSGGAVTAPRGSDVLAAMNDHAADRIEIMAGAGVNEENVRALVEVTGIRSIHASCTRTVAAPALLQRLGFSQADVRETDVEAIRRLKKVLSS